jgi:thiamine kinase-like enzyme
MAMLADLPGEPLHETIPFFHHIGKRLDTFLNSVRSNSAGRAAGVSEEIDFVLKRAEEMKTIIRLGNDGKIPLRITHNDTKFNNILFDNNDKALCVIDLDTVMPGYVHYDFGDAIRTAANVASEDETDLSRIRMDIELYKAFSQGYLSEAKNTINDVEKEYLAFSPKLITYTMAVRFLTDYLDGDIYYKIHHPNHNIDRARAQLKLVKSMEEQYDEMQRTIKGLI